MPDVNFTPGERSVWALVTGSASPDYTARQADKAFDNYEWMSRCQSGQPLAPARTSGTRLGRTLTGKMTAFEKRNRDLIIVEVKTTEHPRCERCFRSRNRKASTSIELPSVRKADGRSRSSARATYEAATASALHYSSGSHDPAWMRDASLVAGAAPNWRRQRIAHASALSR